LRVYRIPINPPFEFRVVVNNEKIAIFLFHKFFNTTPRLRAILLSKDEVKKLHYVLGKIISGDNPIKPIGVEEDVN